MREITLSNDTAKVRTTVLSYGATRSGKTRWAATWPRPLFLAEATERGWTTIRNMDPAVFWEPGYTPRVWAIESVADMHQASRDVEPLIAAGDVQTLVVDSLTFYNDLLLDTLTARASQSGRAPDMRRVYGTLNSNLRTLRILLHSLDCNVIWICLEKTPDQDNPTGVPMISGQQALKFPASTDFILYHRAYATSSQDTPIYEIRTRPWGRYQAGGRDEGVLPDPLGYWAAPEDATNGEDVFVADCTYRTLAEALNLVPLQSSAQPAGKLVGAVRASSTGQTAH